MGGPDSQNQTSHHPELRGCNQRLMGGLSNHLELNGGPNFVFRAEFRLRGRISSSGPNFVFAAECRLRGRISSSGPNFVFAAEFRLRGRISSSGPNFVFAAEFRLQGPISSSENVFRSLETNVCHVFEC